MSVSFHLDEVDRELNYQGGSQKRSEGQTIAGGRRAFLMKYIYIYYLLIYLSSHTHTHIYIHTYIYPLNMALSKLCHFC